jgi:hypothetical protein
MTDDEIRELVAREIAAALERGGLNELLAAHRAALKAFGPKDHTGDAALKIHIGGQAGGDVILHPPPMRAEAHMPPPDGIPAEVVDAMDAASPTLANQARTGPNSKRLYEVFMALMAALTVALAAYGLLHPQAPPPPPAQIFIQTYNVLNPPNDGESPAK